MAQLVVRNLDEDVKLKLQKRARAHGRSTEDEVREILRASVAGAVQVSPPIGTRFAARFARTGLDRELPELRGAARPARLDR